MPEVPKLPAICYAMHPAFAAEVDDLHANVIASAKKIERLKLKLVAIRILIAAD